MDVHITLSDGQPLGDQIFRQLSDAILEGRLRAGDRLPPTRTLAAQLAVSRNTVGVAYERLVSEGLVEGRVGAGSFVADVPVRRHDAARAPSGSVTPRPEWRDAEPFRAGAPPGTVVDFGVGAPDHRLFPLTAWRRLVAAELRTSIAESARYVDPAGLPALRAAIARHVCVSRAVRTSEDDVITTNGAQQAFDLLARILVSPGTRVAIEDPGYGRARAAFAAHGARVAGVPVDDEGLVVEALPPRTRIVYVTPSHQFPTGVAMSLRRRGALLQWADREDAVIVEDDYDTEFRFAGRPLDPLQSLDRTGRVVYVGSFSKVLLPGLRLGFMVAPASVQRALHAARQAADWHGERTNQAALARFIDAGGFAQHLRKLTRAYGDRYVRVVAAVERDLTRWFRVVPAAAGMHVAAKTAPGGRVSAAAVVAEAARRGVRVHALSSFEFERRGADGLVLGYGGVDAARIDEGIAEIARACQAVERRRR